jgi:hypothetical protein
MKVKPRKAAPIEPLKTEKKKVSNIQPAASGKIAKPHQRVAKLLGTPAKKIADAAKKSTPKKSKKAKQKVVRHSFKIPEEEYGMIAALKKKLIAAGIAVKKSDLLRAGIKELSRLSSADLNKKLSKLYLHV